MNDLKDFTANKEDWHLKTSSPARSFAFKLFKVVFALLLFISAAGAYYWINEWGAFSKDVFYLSLQEKRSSLTKEELHHFLRIAHILKKDQLIHKLYHQLLKLDPNDSETMIRIAQFYTQRRQYAEALPFYEAYWKKNIMTADTCFFYGEALSAVGRDEEALHWHYKSMEMSDRYIDNFEALLKLLIKTNKPYEGLSLLDYYASLYPHYVTYLGAYKIQFLEMTARLGNHSSFRVPELNQHYHIPVKFSLLKDPIVFLVDTGATVLTIPREIYNKKIDTARPTGQKIHLKDANNRMTTADQIFLNELKIGPLVLKHVEAVICDHCSLLLGQSVLSRLRLSTEHQDGKNFLIVKGR